MLQTDVGEAEEEELAFGDDTDAEDDGDFVADFYDTDAHYARSGDFTRLQHDIQYPDHLLDALHTVGEFLASQGMVYPRRRDPRLGQARRQSSARGTVQQRRPSSSFAKPKQTRFAPSARPAERTGLFGNPHSSPGRASSTPSRPLLSTAGTSGTAGPSGSTSKPKPAIRSSAATRKCTNQICIERGLNNHPPEKCWFTHRSECPPQALTRRDQIVAEYNARRQGSKGKAKAALFLDADDLPEDFADLTFRGKTTPRFFLSPLSKNQGDETLSLRQTE